jgi:hypothetical protein
MESTLKPRGTVVAALISSNWDATEAFMILAQDMIEPTIYKYLIKNSREKQGFRHIESDRAKST